MGELFTTPDLPPHLWHVCCGRDRDEALSQPLLPRGAHGGTRATDDAIEVCEHSVYLYANHSAANAYSGKLKREHGVPLSTPIVAVETSGLDRELLTIDTEDLDRLLIFWDERADHFEPDVREEIAVWRESLGVTQRRTRHLMEAVHALDRRQLNERYLDLSRPAHDALIAYALDGRGDRQRLMYRGSIAPELLSYRRPAAPEQIVW